MRINGLSCCGVAELSDLAYQYGSVDGTTPEAEKLWQMCVANSPADPEEGFYYRCRYIMFTQASMPGENGAITPNQTGYGFDFAEFIRTNNLGEVIDSIPSGINPNSKNEVKVWMWIPDMTAVRAWLVAEVARRNYTYTPPPQTDYVATYYADPDVDVVAEVPEDLIVPAPNQPRRPNNLRFARAQQLLQQTINRQMFNIPTSRRPR